ncbi:DUF1178 family protein [Altererythrobacter sp. SALINAS58]|uniref:DUF1178 family protein n=1 Tax=Alteripontixanthobacter muriae TaxID=2705546 RepID=UPI0015758789|nr:DUF1178 family protein [Alteripontixanthobacter muriae]NTZ41632.1 DUF1178 family protein [Alteripontixanthobacter muriae]
MIVFDLICAAGHTFEGWFGSSARFEQQCEEGLVACPHCGATEIIKAPMTPAVGAKGNRGLPVTRRHSEGPQRKPMVGGQEAPEVIKAMQALAKAQAKALEGSTWVGDAFAEKSRARHYGETAEASDEKPIHGRATAEDAKALLDEGIAIAPLPFPVAPPDELN